MDETEDDLPATEGAPTLGSVVTPFGKRPIIVGQSKSFDMKSEHKIVQWVLERNARDGYVFTDEFKQYAKSVYKGPKHFSASSGWMTLFLIRHHRALKDVQWKSKFKKNYSESSSEALRGVVPEFEQKIIELIHEEHEREGSISYKEMSRLAQSVYKETRPSFKASYTWIRNFVKRNEGKLQELNIENVIPVPKCKAALSDKIKKKYAKNKIKNYTTEEKRNMVNIAEEHGIAHASLKLGNKIDLDSSSENPPGLPSDPSPSTSHAPTSLLQLDRIAAKFDIATRRGIVDEASVNGTSATVSRHKIPLSLLLKWMKSSVNGTESPATVSSSPVSSSSVPKDSSMSSAEKTFKCHSKETRVEAVAEAKVNVKRDAPLPPLDPKSETIDISCGDLTAKLIRKRFICPGINRECIEFAGDYITPKTFYLMADKGSLKDWKNAIRIHGKKIRQYIDSGVLDFYNHSKLCTSGRCKSRISQSKLNISDTIPNSLTPIRQCNGHHLNRMNSEDMSHSSHSSNDPAVESMSQQADIGRLFEQDNIPNADYLEQQQKEAQAKAASSGDKDLSPTVPKISKPPLSPHTVHSLASLRPSLQQLTSNYDPLAYPSSASMLYAVSTMNATVVSPSVLPAISGINTAHMLTSATKSTDTFQKPAVPITSPELAAFQQGMQRIPPISHLSPKHFRQSHLEGLSMSLPVSLSAVKESLSSAEVESQITASESQIAAVNRILKQSALVTGIMETPSSTTTSKSVSQIAAVNRSLKQSAQVTGIMETPSSSTTSKSGRRKADPTTYSEESSPTFIPPINPKKSRQQSPVRAVTSTSASMEGALPPLHASMDMLPRLHRLDTESFPLRSQNIQSTLEDFDALRTPTFLPSSVVGDVQSSAHDISLHQMSVDREQMAAYAKAVEQDQSYVIADREQTYTPSSDRASINYSHQQEVRVKADSESQRSMFPEAPVTNTTLETEQEAMLRQQEEQRRNLQGKSRSSVWDKCCHYGCKCGLRLKVIRS
ncbi:hypothetical protein DPMN_170797 [Dreissena polymorpha]|uniref:HTH CENPB-type domain-containing protein n=1 Tax=Dreissena polymorpha TaxID=45954 RepID=A0A9D4DWU5_DREPO|nr:hypothetical protein DPMN_170797 [Dreissena polymorpha]